VMKRIAAPMVGGLITSALLTLEIIPVVYTYWRQEQLLWEKLAGLDASRLAALRRWTWIQGAGWALLAVIGGAALYVDLPAAVWWGSLAASAALVVLGTAAYFGCRPAARRLVWPTAGAEPVLPADAAGLVPSIR